MDIYHRLLDAYGPQGWWPGDSRFEMIAGAILTQAITTPYAMATLPRDGIEVVELVDESGAVLLRGSLP